MFDYFYAAQSDQFSFYRIPKVLFVDERFRNLSIEAKVLYGILLDRMNLSARNGWVDEAGRVYIIFTLEEIMAALGCANQKATKLLNELETKCGLISRKRQGLGKPSLIYVKNFISAANNPTGAVKPLSESHVLNHENHDSGSVNFTSLESWKSHGNNTDINNTDYSDTDPFLPGRESERKNERTECEDFFRAQINVDELIWDNPADRDTILGILDLLVDTCCTNRKMIRIAGDDKPADVVKSRFMKLGKEHIDYVLTALSKNTTEVRNMKQYLLAALYNAPTTISPYYQAWVNADMYNGMY